MTILSIDDDIVSQKLLRAVLQKKFSVVTENSGARAISAAEAANPQLILLDLGMPNVDGYEVLNQLKNHAKLVSVPVVCLSGKIDEGSRTRAYALGAAGFIVKPINIATIVGDLEAIMAKLNNEIVSSDGRRRIYIARNATSEHEKLRANIKQKIETGKIVVMLSFVDPESFFTDAERESLRQEKLFFLQVKPSLMARLPYLQESDSVIDDIQQLTRTKLRTADLCVDGLERLINLNDQAQATRVSLTLGEVFSKSFASIDYFCSQPRRNEVAIENLNQIATILTN